MTKPKKATKKVFRGASLTALPDERIPKVAANAGARPLNERAMLVRFSVGRWYGTGADNEVIAELRQSKEARGEIGTFTKRLMDKRHLAEINRITNESRAFFKSKTLPYDDGNLRLLAVEHFFDVKQKMVAYERSFVLAVEKFLHGYQDAIESEKKRLGKLWRESDYPSEGAMRERFRFEVHFRPLESADDLRVNLPKEELEAIRKEITEAVQANIAQAVKGLAEKLRGMLEEVGKRMDDPRERLPKSMIEDLRALCADLPAFNLTNDKSLREATEALNSQFASFASDEEIVKDSGKRESTKKAVKKALDALSVLSKWHPNQE